MTTAFFDALKTAIAQATKQGILYPNDVLTGFSGHKLIGTLQRLARLQADAGHHYLEVGVFQGLSLLSVSMAVDNEAYGIDNFAFLDPDKKNFGIVEQRKAALNITNARIINQDYEDALLSLPSHIGDRKIGLYFVDGPHDYRSQLVCLLFALPYLADNAVIVVDDCNYVHVRQANQDFLKAFPVFKLFFQSYTDTHPINMTAEQKKAAEAGWWNGVNILVKDPNNLIEPAYPPTPRSRKVFENDSELHAARFPESAPLGTRLADAYSRSSVGEIVTLNLKMLKRFGPLNATDAPPFSAANTYSEQLPKEEFCY